MAGFVFVSHASGDREYAQWLCSFLAERGVETWLAAKRSRVGDSWQRTIEKQIATCTAMVVIVSDRARDSSWVRREISFALDTHRPIKPLLLERGLPILSLADLHFEDVTDGGMPSQDFIEDLLREVNSGLPVPTSISGAAAAVSGRRPGYPDAYLSENEVVVTQLRRHWSTLGETVGGLLLAVEAYALPLRIHETDVAGIATEVVFASVVVLLVGRRYLSWLSSQVTLTSERLMTRPKLRDLPNAVPRF